MKPLRFWYVHLLKVLSDLEFAYYKDNQHVGLRRKFLRASRVSFEDPISIGRDFYLRDAGGLTVGHHACFGSFTRIWNYAPINIGDHFLSAGGLTLNCGSHDPLTLRPGGGPITIGDRVWIGINVTILGGVTIGNDVVVGAGSLVTKDLAANGVYVGTPARRIKDLDRSRLASIWGAWGDIKLPSDHGDEENPIQCLLRKGDFKGAYERVTKAIASGANDPALWVFQARAAVQLGLIEEFERAMQAAMSSNANFGPAHALMGELMAAGGQFDDAARHYSIAIAQAPRDVELRTRLDHCLENAVPRSPELADGGQVLPRARG
jgi:maltose O-acetyltransferase